MGQEHREHRQELSDIEAGRLRQLLDLGWPERLADLVRPEQLIRSIADPRRHLVAKPGLLECIHQAAHAAGPTWATPAEQTSERITESRRHPPPMHLGHRQADTTESRERIVR